MHFTRFQQHIRCLLWQLTQTVDVLSSDSLVLNKTTLNAVHYKVRSVNQLVGTGKAFMMQLMHPGKCRKKQKDINFIVT